MAFFLFETTEKKNINHKPNYLLIIKWVSHFGVVMEKVPSGNTHHLQ